MASKWYSCKFCKIKVSQDNIDRLESKGKITRLHCGGPACVKCGRICMDPDCIGYQTRANIEKMKAQHAAD